MVKMLNQLERQAFSERLHLALKNSSLIKTGSPSAVAKEFNSRYMGKAVTLHAVRKWMVGEAIPNQPKLLALSQWLGVAPDWLRFGTGSPSRMVAQQSTAAYHTVDPDLLNDLQRLTTEQKRMVREFVSLMLRKGQ
jgi:hypothetical protein